MTNLLGRSTPWEPLSVPIAIELGNQHVTLLLAAPTVSTNNIGITYEYSEFDQTFEA